PGSPNGKLNRHTSGFHMCHHRSEQGVRHRRRVASHFGLWPCTTCLFSTSHAVTRHASSFHTRFASIKQILVCDILHRPKLQLLMIASAVTTGERMRTF